MSKTKLPILVVLSHCVDVALLAYKEAKVVSTRNSLDLNLVAERHFYRIADLLPLHSEGPSKGFSTLAGNESQITTCSKAAHLQLLLREESKSCWLMDVSVMTEA